MNTSSMWTMKMRKHDTDFFQEEKAEMKNEK